MRFCCGWGKKPLVLSESWKYHPEQILNMLGLLPPDLKMASPLARMQVWLQCEDEYVKVERNNIDLACKLVAIKHNALCQNAPFYDEDIEGWQEWVSEGGSEDGIGCLSGDDIVEVYE